MSHLVAELERHAALRSLAQSKLTGSADDASASASAALSVLYDLASSPATASDALRLLHELQVHQVELDLQAEELRGSRVELETALRRQTQLYDFAPVGCFTVDAGTVLHELNLAGAKLLGVSRDELLGQALDSFVAPQGVQLLHGMIARLNAGSTSERAAFAVRPREGGPRNVQAYVHPDPAGGAFLVALVDLSDSA